LSLSAFSAELPTLSAAVDVELRVPYHAAYQDQDAADVEPLAVWYGRLAGAGTVLCSVELEAPVGYERELELSVSGHTLASSVKGADGLQVVRIGEFKVDGAGYQKFELVARGARESASKGDLRIKSLLLSGAPLEGAHFNLESRRNAASVHLAYPIEEQEVMAFYCEVSAEEDPVWTYYMATGWHRGYFGMQVNSETERRIIFSVWDSSNEAVDREKVADEDRVQLVAHGDQVVTGSFGNEGTGGHSHLVFDWKTGEKQRFLVTAKADDETHTTFTGYYFRRDLKRWMLISSWRAPKEGKLLRGLYSFSENFSGRNGHLLRRASFGNQWVRTVDGQWREQTKATFSFDATGKRNRLDRYMGVAQGEFFLSHGGFVEGTTKFGTLFEREPLGVAPVFELPE
jgi:hypothetical protein